MFDGHSMGSQGSNVSLGKKLIFLSDYADALTDFNLCCKLVPYAGYQLNYIIFR